MYYYNPNDRSSRRWATIAMALYGLATCGALAFGGFDAHVVDPKGQTLYVEFVESPPEPPAPPSAPPEAPSHEQPAPTEETARSAGREAETRTPNPRALFRMTRSGADEPEDAGNPRAPEGEESSAGNGPDLNPEGFDQLDRGLQGRGLRGALPKPSYPGNRSGRIVVRVTVDRGGGCHIGLL